jgi:hypothetical protein
MTFIIHDMTGTQTDCEKPLSRKKLRQLCCRNKPVFSARNLERHTGRLSKATKERMRETEAEQKRERALQLAGVPGEDRGPDGDPLTGTSVFKRLRGMFANMTQRFQRAQARGN